jgi:hypothetical protein
MKVEARAFNLAAERYYRDDLRKAQLAESLELLAEECAGANSRWWFAQGGSWRAVADPQAYLTAVKNDLVEDQINTEEILQLVGLILMVTLQGESADV